MTNGTESQPTPSGNRGLMIVLAYLWILALIPLLVEKEDAEVQWHAKHGLVLLVAELVCWIAFSMVASILGLITAGIGCLFSLFVPLIWLLVLIVHIVAIAKGINGQRLIIPGISLYADRF